MLTQNLTAAESQTNYFINRYNFLTNYKSL